MSDGSSDEERTVTGFEREARLPDAVGRSDPSRLGSLAGFLELSSRSLREIESSSFERRFEPGEYLMRQGDEADGLFVVQKGTVEVRLSTDGATHVLERAGAGVVLGEMALLTREPRTADVVAVSDVHALMLPVDEFHRLARTEPALAEVLSRLTAERLGQERLDALSGKIFQGYTIRRRLGRGGQAVVYEAIENASGRRVALKMMSHRLVYNDAACRRFQREADLIESFDHPNIARMFGRFEAFHTFFIVMEFCDGVALDEAVDARGRLEVETVRRILGQLASALEYAHRRRVVHRDIKPSNAMVDRDGTVKLMDFGLASTIAETGCGPSASIAGTPPYMAPEQLVGHPPGIPADLYALGGLAWKMLTGCALFEAKDFLSLRQAHLEWDIPDITRIRPDVGDDLRDVLARSLVANPDDRRLDFEAVKCWAGPIDYARLVDPEDDSSGRDRE